MGEISGPLLHGRPSYANFLSPNEINEINDSCKWSFTVPNFYVKFSTLLPLLHTQGARAPCIHARFLSREEISFRWIQRGKSVISPSPYNIEMLDDRRRRRGRTGTGSRQKQSVGDFSRIRPSR